MDFSIITQSPAVRAIVQENLLERAFHDALFPRMLFRTEAAPSAWPAGVGDTQIFSAPGLMAPDGRPLLPGADPEVASYPMEQWQAQLQQYGKSIDTHMPTSMVAIANLFMRNAHQLGMQAAQTVNRVVRNRMYNAAESGWTVADGGQGPVSTLRVQRLNGFTRARNPSLAAGSQVRFDAVSATNPLSIEIFDTAGPAYVTRLVTAFAPDEPGDEIGPGTITFTGGNVTVLDRAAIKSVDRTYIVRVGGGDKVDDVGAGDLPTLASVRDVVAHLWEQNVPEHGDGRFHCHLDPVSQAKIFADTEFQRLLTALPDYYMYRQFSLGELLNTVFFRNSECPMPHTVLGGATATFNQGDAFAGELYNNGTTSGVVMHRMLFSAQGGIFEYYSDLANLVTEAGITGKLATPQITNNGIEVMSDRIQLIIRAPLNRLQDKVSTTWRLIADWPARTDASTGDASRYKRFAAIIHGA
jgi:hypothetical protein